MQRHILIALTAWKNRPDRKPLLLDGARQTGKTYLLERLLGQTFARVLRIDFLEQPHMAKAFEGSLVPEDVLTSIELLSGQGFDAAHDLLILDEIGECPRAVTALKYFAEKMPRGFVAASGSNIGLLGAFPVGKVELHEVRPLSFAEFVAAAGSAAVQKAFAAQTDSEAAHSTLMDLLTDYYFVGGMPEAVATWMAHRDSPVLERIAAVTAVHRNLLDGYRRDFGKYAGKVNAHIIESVFNHVPAQLGAVMDESVKRFRFKDVVAGKSRYADFETAIAWLHKCKLVLKNQPIEGLPTTPLAARFKGNCVKLFLFDVGLLNHMLGSGYREIKEQAYACKGFVAENFVQQELAALGLEPTASWGDARAEIEFLLTDAHGRVVPVEVKSGKRTRAKSLQSYIEKCQPHMTLKLTGTRASGPDAKTHRVLPLYHVQAAVALLS